MPPFPWVNVWVYMNSKLTDQPRHFGEGAYLASQICGIVLVTLFVSGAISNCLSSVEASKIALSSTTTLYFYQIGPAGLWLIALLVSLLLVVARFIASSFARTMFRFVVFVAGIGFLAFGMVSVAIPLHALAEIAEQNFVESTVEHSQ